MRSQLGFTLLICRRDSLSSADALNLAAFLGEQVCNIHLLPVPWPSPVNSTLSVGEDHTQPSHGNGSLESADDKIYHPSQWKSFASILNRKRKDVSKRLAEW